MKEEKFSFKVWWQTAEEEEIQAAYAFCDDYVRFLNDCKTEREVADYAKKELEKQGFRDLTELLAAAYQRGGCSLQPGDKVYQLIHGKSVLAAVIGRKPIQQGVNIVASHIDSPRLDFKQTPFYEDSNLVLAKTHYYGGIKKYQWVTLPLALHGTVILKDGRQVKVSVGDREGDPCFVITDLLPHLAQNQMVKKAAEVVSGEGLNVLLGSLPLAEESKEDQNQESLNNTTGQEGAKFGGEPVKANLLKLLEESYGIREEDFISAEIEVVPALAARDVGFDRSLVGGYGQDDRVCTYTALQAFLELAEVPERTALIYFSDKEEVGSQGNTGAQSAALSNFIAELCAAAGDVYNDLLLRRCLAGSTLLSADVSAGVDPNYKDVQDGLNANYIGKGVTLEKYTGARGKSGGNDANPELIARLRRIFDEEKVAWQTGEMGKIDLGGGGTIAMFMANLGMQVIDCGTPVLSMHSPFEIAGKGDVYNTYRAYRAFFEKYC